MLPPDGPDSAGAIWRSIVARVAFTRAQTLAADTGLAVEGAGDVAGRWVTVAGDPQAVASSAAMVRRPWRARVR